MNLKHLSLILLSFLLISCNSTSTPRHSNESKSDTKVEIVAAMQEVMWEGDLSSRIDLDTLAKSNGFYGLGPLEGLRGELLVMNGQKYVSRVLTDSSMQVDLNPKVGAPFFVYANVNQWIEKDIPANIKTIQALESYIEEETLAMKRPFAFKLVGTIKQAVIHVQNLAPGTEVSSPKEAHQGQVNYRLENEQVEILGFFSTKHQGIFTHHDSYLHMHLITADKSQMGHLDEMEIDSMKLFLPKE